MGTSRDALEAMVDALNAHDLEAVAALAPGDERFRESNRQMLDTFPDVRIDPMWTVEEGDRAVGWARIRGTHLGGWRDFLPTGRAVDFIGMIALQTDSAGQVVDFWVLNDALSLYLQLGATITPPAATE
jgi:predicted ester cyclase